MNYKISVRNFVLTVWCKLPTSGHLCIIMYFALINPVKPYLNDIFQSPRTPIKCSKEGTTTWKSLSQPYGIFLWLFHCAYQWILLVVHKSYLKLAWGLLINGTIKTYISNNISAKQKYNLHKHINIYITAIKNTYLCMTSTCNWNLRWTTNNSYKESGLLWKCVLF